MTLLQYLLCKRIQLGVEDSCTDEAQQSAPQLDFLLPERSQSQASEDVD